MSAEGGVQTLLVLKKLGALILLAAGLGAIAVGYNGENFAVIVVGLLLIAGSIIILTLKVIRRNSMS